MTNRLLVVFIDAFGPYQQQRYSEYFSFLPFHKTLHGILGYSSGALPTILTGELPSEHGRMCLFSAREHGTASVLKPMRWLGLLPRVLHERSQVRRVAQRILKQHAKLEGYVALHKVPPELFEWLDLPEKEDMFIAEDIGGVSTFLADARAAGLSVYSAPWQLPEQERWKHSLKAIGVEAPDLAFLYSADLDGIMHAEGPNGLRSFDTIKCIAENINRARELMSTGGADLTTLILGDHGMAEVHTAIDPRPGLRQLCNMRIFVDCTMLRAWGNDHQISVLRKVIKQSAWPGKWLQGSALEKRSVPKNERFGRGIFVLDEGVIFAPNFLGGSVAGMHGYDTDCASSKAALASDKPIKKSVKGIDSIANFIRHRLELI